MEQFIEPIKKKWIYNFIVSNKTNLLEKPEWYLNQTLKWIYEYIDIVEDKATFIKSMLELVMIRLKKDMGKISSNLDEEPQNEVVLVHTYNELIHFIKVIRQLLGDSYAELEDHHDLMSVFSNEKLFEKINDVEWKYAEKNLKLIINSGVSWNPVLDGDFVDNYKIPVGVDRLLMLIQALTERVECFRQLDCQFKLIELQCSLFNKFLVFLKNSLKNETSPVGLNIISDMLLLRDESTIDLTRILIILNSTNFIRLILKEQYFIPESVKENLDITLLDKSTGIAQDYKKFFFSLVTKVISIYEDVECDYQRFLDFIKPKLSHHIFEIIRDEASKIHEKRRTQDLLEGLSLG